MEEIILVDELLDYDKVTYPLIYPTLYNGIKNYRKEWFDENNNISKGFLYW